MEHLTSANNARDDIAARNRLKSFKLGKGLPSGMPPTIPTHKHARSHSRNTSISSSSLSLSSKSMSVHDLSSFSFPPASTNPTGTTPLGSPAAPSKRNSHHRRRSSVSTRHESAEMMGVTIPDLPHCPSDDNVNFGEKDSIRRRALWALEGKPDAPFPKVEIPEFSDPDVEKFIFDFPTKPSYPPGSSSNYGNGLNSLVGNKRDSFKLLAASGSSKDQLHTLIEEEEEEEEEEEGETQGGPEHSLPSPSSSVYISLPTTPIHPAPTVAVTKSTPLRPRPATLNLRPLSLTPENLITTVQGLPTPSLTPSPTTGARSLSLTPSPTNDDTITSVAPAQSSSSRRPVLNLKLDHCESPSPMSEQVDNKKPARRSSISYKRSSHGVAVGMAGLPTPEMTPTFSRRFSIAESVRSSNSGDEEFFPTQTRPLSASEQHFLFKSHNALLARITDLERALSTRRSSGGFSLNESSRPNSVSSNFSSSSDFGSMSGEPSDEMFSFVRDLKAERDELKKDVDGWRTRVGDLEKQLGIMTNRVDAERRDAWVARSRVGLLEVEKASLEKRFEAVDQAITGLEQDKRVLQEENEVLQQINSEMKKRVEHLEAEVEVLKNQLVAQGSPIQHADPLATPTPDVALPRKRGLGFTSIDSESSVTDAESDSFDVNQHNFGFMLKAVEEESEADEEEYSEEENGLAGYEDEEESDVDFTTSSSFGSEEDAPRSLGHLEMEKAPAYSQSTPPVLPNVFVPARSTHASRASLSKTWTFPKGTVNRGIPQEKEDNSVDRFFGCLEELDTDSDGSAPMSPSVLTYETSKGLFASGFTYGSVDDNAPFFLPGGVGVLAEGPIERAEKRLSAVAETEEDVDKTHVDGEDDDMFGEIGGIRITFTPPEETEAKLEPKQLQISPIKAASQPPVLPVLNFCDEEEEEEDLGVIPFNFGRPLTSERLPSPPLQPTMITPHASIPGPTSPRAASPSSIPRSTTFRRPINSSEIPASTPPKPTSGRSAKPLSFSSSTYVTPPTKRGGAMPSFIPQPVSSPSPMRGALGLSKPKAAPTSSYIPQPLRKPIIAASGGKSQKGTNEHTPMNTRSSRRSSDDRATITATCSQSSSEMKDVELSRSFDPVPQPYPCSEDSQSSISSASSSFSSIMSSPLASRLSFQTFSNFMTWGPRHDVAVPSAVSVMAPSRSIFQPEPTRPISQKQVFVSREQQLRKLKFRMETEGTLVMRNSVRIHCKRCDDGLVSL